MIGSLTIGESACASKVVYVKVVTCQIAKSFTANDLGGKGVGAWDPRERSREW